MENSAKSFKTRILLQTQEITMLHSFLSSYANGLLYKQSLSFSKWHRDGTACFHMENMSTMF